MINLILGGARSGKSAYGELLAAKTAQPKLYIATCEPFDEEMRTRVARHRQDRAAAQWQTVEAPLDIVSVLNDRQFARHAVLVDCLTLWLSNLMYYQKNIVEYRDALVKTLAGNPQQNITLVANEVGLGIVPESALGRAFRDEAGRLHQSLAAIADRVVWMVAGIPTAIKGTLS